MVSLVLKERLEQVRNRIENAAARAGRNAGDILLLAVTKKFPPPVMLEAFGLGLREFGENYVQEFEEKRPALDSIAGTARFHLIGHLQSNKSKKASELFQAIQTVDSAKLVRRLAETGAKLELMIEVKLSHEEAKYGASPDSLGEIIDAVATYPNLALGGLMTMPPWTEDAEQSRPYFRRLRELAEKHELKKLSMGMSHDLEESVIGFHSPLPPAKTGVADYSAALLRHLQQLGPVEVNAASADVDLYHLGNNHLHRAIYRLALERPGVVVIHDAVLQHLFLGSLTESEYIAEFRYNYGDWGKELAGALWQGRARSATDPRYFRYPMLRRVSESSKAVIVHNPAAAQMVQQHAPTARVYEIPHLWEQPEIPPVYEVERLRRSLGVPRHVLLCGILGHLRESKRVATAIRAFRRVRTKYPIALLLAGEFASTDLERGIEPLLASEGIIRAGYLSEPEWWRYASAVDLGINLKYPAAGETSGIAIRMMGLGKPVILSSGLETSRFPECAHLTVDSGAAEEEMLAVCLAWAAESRASLLQMGERAATYVRGEHAAERVAGLYWKLLSDCYHEG